MYEGIMIKEIRNEELIAIHGTILIPKRRARCDLQSTTKRYTQVWGSLKYVIPILEWLVNDHRINDGLRRKTRGGCRIAPQYPCTNGTTFSPTHWTGFVALPVTDKSWERRPPDFPREPKCQKGPRSARRRQHSAVKCLPSGNHTRSLRCEGIGRRFVRSTNSLSILFRTGSRNITGNPGNTFSRRGA